MKNIFVHIRSSLKLIFLLIISLAIIIGIISFFYKPVYGVTLNGEFIGYTSNKKDLQTEINEYMSIGDGENVAFTDIEILPEYSLCLLKRTTETSDEEIFSKVISNGVNYYSYYAIIENSNEKYYVSTEEEAKKVLEELKEKNSNNINSLAYTKVYGTELQEFTETDKIVTALYQKKVTYTSSGVKVASSSTKIDLSQYGVNLSKPISSGYTITSRYGARSSGTHSGLDVAAPTGTTIYAAESGTVTFVKYSNVSYGNYLKISHGNGVETLYAHCNELFVTEGQTVSKGEAIASVGSTGNSTGPHLHFEIRVNGTALNPQNYLY